MQSEESLNENIQLHVNAGWDFKIITFKCIVLFITYKTRTRRHTLHYYVAL